MYLICNTVSMSTERCLSVMLTGTRSANCLSVGSVKGQVVPWSWQILATCALTVQLVTSCTVLTQTFVHRLLTVAHLSC